MCVECQWFGANEDEERIIHGPGSYDDKEQLIFSITAQRAESIRLMPSVVLSHVRKLIEAAEAAERRS